ncbi:MAG: hypothetical protein UX99_C0020G0003 [Candidatus Amesbacteria bacterium GW2011_GWB1_47_26]|uniref:Uncharacterized protein n=1 Tax=Candidatus Amesbacteria bacterium GW2011_GWC2_45_19 TaxID=1618366 RepID=A0A0G1M3S8_9BACT|nr:MAG: hypothetical protein UX05_C0006G0037 [Candidatus Amesbacteria bacterium GW2011_GWC2_45_19]KKU37232.1 MAG: hypothetical protein UX52_C0032G0003 [Candidatus Amesbacteria bacterium GW2011_GWA1_46_35]KKU68249.1 MAG: hypothetical protein UX93_C0009G0023 [Microgenomates group bacterium GW2011_GWC1_47_20]KKU74234.1 MAG: hypothetical protein UX99_C0020G0003 [Candidatus Amesbacteria bacterium GW2011_GWB1_47_26]KKU79053.1 MAG: hypothetical protein UY06_C0032G0010 [Candidatus Amesbacteria bacteriu
MADEFHVSEGPDKGRVTNDQGRAQELAGLEATKGRNAALAREGELKRQMETGSTDDERNNLAIMAGVKEKYPDACDAVVDSKGREFLRLRQDSEYSNYFTQYGVVFAGELPDEAVVNDAGEIAGGRKKEGVMLDLTSRTILDSLSRSLKRIQERESAAKEAVKSKAASSLAQNVLAKL